jgi:cold shock CspA family protein
MRTHFWFPLPLAASILLATMVFGQNQAGLNAPPPAATGANTAANRDNYDPLLDLPPLTTHRITLMGGIVINADEVMNRMNFRPFGTRQKLQVHFDTRTHFYLDGKPITEREIKPGQRIYLDTMLNGDRVFAKTIWIRSTAESGVGRGQILNFDSQRQVVTIQEELSNQPIKLKLTPATVVRKGNQAGSESDLAEGALVSLDFGGQRELRNITVLASPGSVFTFAGRVTYVDVSQKLISLDNRSDGKKYDLHMDAIAPSALHQLHEGDDVSVSAVFDGSGYSARSIQWAGANPSGSHP